MSAEAFEGKSRMLPPLPPADTTLAPPPMPPGAFAEEAGRCANCLSVLTGPFCARCGQHVADYHRSVWRFVTDFFESAFSWDNKFLRTVDPLLRRPGWLTQEFMAGRRVRYVHPLRLFLFTSFVCLALLQWTHNAGFQVRVHKVKDPKKLASLTLSSGDKAKDADKDDDDDEDKAAAKPPVASPTVEPSPTASAPPAASPAVSPTASSAADPDNLASLIHDTVQDSLAGGDKAKALDKRLDSFGDRLQKKIDAAGGMEKFNERMTTNVQSKLSWVALAMLPIFALFMRVSFGRAGGYYFTYLVFSLHYHTFLLMFWVVYAWVSGIANYLHSDLLQIATALGLFVPPWYLFRALRQMYGQAWSVTAAKVFAIGAVHLLTLFAGLAMIGATAFL